MNKITRVILLALVSFQISYSTVAPTMNYFDHYPLYSTEYPFSFLNTNKKEFLKGDGPNINNRFQLTASVYGQTARTGYDQDKLETNLGDIRGRFDMLGLLYGSTPTGATQPALLTTAAAQTYDYDAAITLAESSHSDTADRVGHFSVPLRYRRFGLRLHGSVRLLENIVVSVHGGVSDLRQTASEFINIGRDEQTTVLANPTTVYGPTTSLSSENKTNDLDTIDKYLMDIDHQIFDQMGLNVQDFHETDFEDLFVSFVWRSNVKMNVDEKQVHDDFSDEWEPFILMPFVKVTAGFGTGRKKDESKAFSLPFGNNGHHSVTVSSGLSFDFYDSVEITIDGGGTHFFNRTINNMFMPTHEKQTGIFPYKTSVDYSPGQTWYFSANINAHHFNDKLSCYAQYLYTTHTKDSITLLAADSAFKPAVLEDRTNWNVHSANLGFNYDLSRRMSVGFAWQAPIAQRGAYKTHTLMLSLNGLF